MNKCGQKENWLQQLNYNKELNLFSHLEQLNDLSFLFLWYDFIGISYFWLALNFSATESNSKGRMNFTGMFMLFQCAHCNKIFCASLPLGEMWTIKGLFQSVVLIQLDVGAFDLSAHWSSGMEEESRNSNCEIHNKKSKPLDTDLEITGKFTRSYLYQLPGDYPPTTRYYPYPNEAY